MLLQPAEKSARAPGRSGGEVDRNPAACRAGHVVLLAGAMVRPALEAGAAEGVAAGAQIIDGSHLPGRLHADGAVLHHVTWQSEDVLMRRVLRRKALARGGKAGLTAIVLGVVVVVGVVVVAVGAVGAVVVDLLVPRTRRNTASRKDRWKIIKLGRISSSVSWSCSFARKRRNMVVSRSCCAASLLSFDLGEAS